jgi:hypothetical protein
MVFQIREKFGYLLQSAYALQRTIVQFSVFLEQATKNELPYVPTIADVEPVEHCPMFRASMWVLQGQRKCRPVFGIVHTGHDDVRSDVIAKGHGIHRYSFPLQSKGTVDLGQGIDHLVLSKVMWGEQLPTDVHGFDNIPIKCPDVQSGMSRLAKGMIQPRQSRKE